MKLAFHKVKSPNFPYLPRNFNYSVDTTTVLSEISNTWNSDWKFHQTNSPFINNHLTPTTPQNVPLCSWVVGLVRMKHHLLSHKPIYLLSFIFLILHSHNPTRAEEVLENPLVYCLYGANYTNGSQFETNLNRLLPSLTTNGPLNNNTFYNTSNGKDPDQVYGFSQCLSGASIDECRLCLNNSRVQILQKCPNKKQAAVRYSWNSL